MSIKNLKYQFCLLTQCCKLVTTNTCELRDCKTSARTWIIYDIKQEIFRKQFLKKQDYETAKVNKL